VSGDHQSIGEVLATLRGDFPDITNSKIRFLESQGLIDPERTPSGYRKFRDGDVARLRWILHQQKDNFLPLKVIKARLDEAGPDGLPADGDGGSADEHAEPAEPAEAVPAEAVRAGTETQPPVPASAPARSSARTARAKAPRASKARRSTPRASAATGPRATDATAPPTFEAPTLPLDDGTDDDLVAETSGASLTRAELAAASGLGDAQLTELEEYGLLTPAAGSGSRVVYDEDSLVVAKIAAEFAAHGIGPRHLRMYRAFAEREAGLYDQVIAPRLKRKNPQARAQAREDLVDLARLGRALRSVFLRSATAGLLRDQPRG
jgi:DNA-binding transcriptional MerR regulator